MDKQRFVGGGDRRNTISASGDNGKGVGAVENHATTGIAFNRGVEYFDHLIGFPGPEGRGEIKPLDRNPSGRPARPFKQRGTMGRGFFHC